MLEWAKNFLKTLEKDLEKPPVSSIRCDLCRGKIAPGKYIYPHGWFCGEHCATLAKHLDGLLKPVALDPK